MLIGGVVLTALLINVLAKKPKAEECGILGSRFKTNTLDYVRRSRRIMGGYTVDIREAPWVVRIDRTGEGHVCTGTLISKRHVLTAGHCFTKNTTTNTCSLDQQEYSVCRLTNNNNLPCPKSYKNGIKKIHFVDNYINQGCTPYYDFVVVELEKKITDITPVCLPIPTNGIFPHQRHTKNTYYLGYSNNGGYTNKQLNYVMAGVPIDENDVFLRTPFNNSAAFCHGDSGGPMIEIHDNKAVLIGVNVNADGSCVKNSIIPAQGKTPPYMQRSVKVQQRLALLKTLEIPSLVNWTA